jgi:brefeldin A-resistance guanine nucleotide exchange factor 1
VLSNGGYLVPPDEKPEKETLWNETWKRINRFQPNLFAELFPDEVDKPKRSKDEQTSRDEKPKEAVAEKQAVAEKEAIAEKETVVEKEAVGE